MSEQRKLRLPAKMAAVYARLVCAVLVVLLVGLTVVQWPTLRAEGWDPVRRTPTEWPSILALGQVGCLLPPTFVLCASALVVLSARVRGCHPAGYRGVRSGLVTAASGFVGVAFNTDPPGAANQSWHALIHNVSYPLIPLGLTGAALCLALGRSRQEIRVPAYGWTAALSVTFAVTNVDPVAQAARYAAFAVSLGWVWRLSRITARDMSGTVRSSPHHDR